MDLSQSPEPFASWCNVTSPDRGIEFLGMKIRYDGNGVHLFERRTGLNILVDEIAVPAEKQDQAPRFVSIALTNACDLKCNFCYAPKHPAKLDAQSVISWATQLDANGCLGLGLGGGEPTLHPDFISICRDVSAKTQLAVSFTTHGHRLTETMVESLSGHVHFVRVSLDGTASMYESIRGRSFAVLLEKLQLAREIAPFGVNYVVNSKTISDLDSAATAVFELGAFEMLLLPEHPVGPSEGIDLATEGMLGDWIRQNQRYRLALSETGLMDGVPVAEPFADDRGLTAYAHIDASGHLRTSSFSRQMVKIHGSVMEAVSNLRADSGGAF